MPSSLQAAIDAELAGHSARNLAAASAAVSDDYAAGRPSAIADEARHAAYLAVRLPATYAAVIATLAMIPEDMRGSVTSLLDLGCGPGTATWAALAQCPSLAEIVQVDRSAALLAIGARLASRAFATGISSLTQRTADIGGDHVWPPVDLVIAAYTLAELPAAARPRAVHAAWQAARQALVLVEPGTPTGFARIHEARTALVGDGAAIVAPCPHDGPCPMWEMDGRTEWCHFAVRVPRSRRHRQVKGGTLGYEDEKYSCLVVTRDGQHRQAPARVLRHPRIEKGRIALELCTKEGAVRSVITRRDEAWRAARKAAWGDAWDGAGQE